MSRSPDTAHAVLAGVITAVVGFTSSFAVVLAGLEAVGAEPSQAASGLMIVSLTMGLGCILFSATTRRPITMAWSTPGAALLATMARPDGGFATAVGAFLLTGVLLVLTGYVPALAAVVRRVPTPIASAMLAGVLLALIAEPVRQLPHQPWAIGTVFAVWAVLTRLAPRWAVPGALVGAVVVLISDGAIAHVHGADLAPHLTWTTPAFHWSAIVAIAIPLYLVTMTSQNIPGVAVMKSLGYEVPWRPALGYTGAATALGAGLGGHAINLSAIAAALAAGPEAGKDPARRWIAGVTTGVAYVAFGLTSRLIVAVAQHAPVGVFAAVAAVGLLGSLAASAVQALEPVPTRVAAAVTLVVATSGLDIAGIGSAFWALVAGCVLSVVLKRSLRG